MMTVATGDPPTAGAASRVVAPVAARCRWRSTPACSGLIAALGVIWVLFNFLSDGLFLSPRNLWNLSVQSAAVAIMATGMVLVIVSRNIDLSIGSILGFIGMFMALLQTEWIPKTLRPRPRPALHLDHHARRRASPSARPSAACRGSSSPTSASRRSS